MATCFVIQPFDGGKYDKRYTDTYKPAIEAAGLEAYRVDEDNNVSEIKQAIEDGIRNASICLADITTNNPNVWYELGFAFASKRPVVMTCSEERKEKYPFDIQSMKIIAYKCESTSDFDKLQKQLTDQLKAIVNNADTIEQLAGSDLIEPVGGMSLLELSIIVTIASNCIMPSDGVSAYIAKQGADNNGINGIGYIVGLRKLMLRNFVKAVTLHDERGESYDGIQITEKGLDWIGENEHLFKTHNMPVDDSPVELPDPFAED